MVVDRAGAHDTRRVSGRVTDSAIVEVGCQTEVKKAKQHG